MPLTVDELLQAIVDHANQGAPVRIDAICKQFPQWSEELRDILPTMLLFDQSRKFVIRPDSPGFGALCGRRIGSYEIGRVIGRGGMGVVYEATQHPLGRRVAVKLLNQVEPTDKARKRFEQEFRIAASLHHANIVPVFDAGEDNGQLYFAMQLIDGVRISEWADRELSRPGLANETIRAQDDSTNPVKGAEKQSWNAEGSAKYGEQVVPNLCHEQTAGSFQLQKVRVSEPGRYYFRIADVVAQVARALAFAHERGILHRDIKPANILIDASENAWISDFGLARPAEAQNLTATGDIAGTIRYMAPERMQGLCDARADVYSLGLVLAELVTGRPAWEGRDGPELIKRLSRADRCGFEWTNDVPSDLRMIVNKATGPHPEQRYQAALEFASDLDRFVNMLPISARPMSRMRNTILWVRRNPGVAALWSTLLVTLAGGTIASSVLAWNWQIAAREAGGREREAVAENRRATKSLHLTDAALAAMTSGTVSRYLASRQTLADADRQFLNNILEFHQRLGALAHDDEWSRNSYATSLRQIARIREMLGEHQAAEDNLRESIRRFESLAADFPDSAKYRLETAGSLLNLGGMLDRQARFDAAIQCWEQSRDLIQSLPHIPELAERIGRDHASALTNIAMIHVAQNRFDQAIPVYRRAIELRKRLLEESPGSSALQNDLAKSLGNFQFCLVKANRKDEAMSVTETLLPLRMSLAECSDDPQRWMGAKNVLVVLARLQQESQKMDDAEASLVKAESIVSRLAAEYPAAPEYRQHWASTLIELGMLLAGTAEPEQAAGYFERAASLLEALVEEFPEQAVFKGMFAEALDWIAQMTSESDAGRAIELWEQSILLYEELSENDKSGFALEGKNQVLIRMADCYRHKLNDETTALLFYEQAKSR